MTKTLKKLSHIALAIGAMAIGGTANAAVSWSLTSGNCIAGDCTNLSSPLYGNSMTFKNSSGAGANAVLTAWSNTAASSTLATAEANLYDPNGIGVRNQNTAATSGVINETTSPNHAIDNDTNTDSVLLNFGGTAVTLNSLKLGWMSGDSDVSVLAYTGAGAPTLAGKTYANIGTAGSGWTKVADLSNVGTTNAASFNTAGTYSSSYWLISAYNSAFGGALDSTKDYFKLQVVGGNLPAGGGGTGVPAPATALLMLAGLPIMASVSRRRKNKEKLAA